MKTEKVMNIIGDYDIIVDDPEKHAPYAIFCSTIDAIDFMGELMKANPEANWQIIRLDEWQKIYTGGKL